MRGLLDGVEGGSVSYFKAADRVLQFLLTNDDGTVLDLTGGAVSLIFYSDLTRATISLTVAGALVTATGGRGTVTLTNAAFTLAAGTTYYAYLKFVDASSKVYFSAQYFTVTVK